MRNDFELSGHRCHTHSAGDSGPCVIWCAGTHTSSDPFGELLEVLGPQEDSIAPFTIFCFEVDDWDNEISPWPMEAEGMKFGDGGKDTLKWIKSEAIPYIRSTFPQTSQIAITGYSLAGLFALWSFYESDAFRAAGCCSGSLWFKGWNEYADSAKVPQNSAVYLSLGGKEAGSGNIVTASIGSQYLLQKKRLENSKDLRAFKYELNQGGHFSNPVKRVVKSVVWLIEELAVY